MIMLYRVLDFALKAVEVLIVIRIILSWVPLGRGEFAQTIYQLTEPILAPLRVMIPIGNMRLDLAPIVAYFIIGLLRKLLIIILF